MCRFVPLKIVESSIKNCRISIFASFLHALIHFSDSVFSLHIPSQVSRSIGDAYLKKSEFNKSPLLAKFRLPQPFDKPILLAEPSIQCQKLHPEDQFLIFASDGLWEHLTNQEAVDIVHNSSRNVSSPELKTCPSPGIPSLYPKKTLQVVCLHFFSSKKRKSEIKFECVLEGITF